MPLTYKDRFKFEKIMNDTLEALKKMRDNNFVFQMDVNSLLDMVPTAKRYCKINNFLLKEESNDALYRVNCLDTETNELVWVNMKASKLNSVKNIFILEVLKAQYCTKQEFIYFKNLFK